MARYCGDKDSSKLLEAMDKWKESCFINDGSILSNESVWTLNAVQELKHGFVDNPDESERGYFEKLEQQLSALSPKAVALMAEIHWLLFAIQTNMKPQTKVDYVKKIWSWSRLNEPEGNLAFDDRTLSGLVNTGTAYNTLRWAEVADLITVMAEVKSLNIADRKELLNEPIKFALWLQDLPMKGTRVSRHVLRYYCFPDYFERMVVNKHKKAILKEFDNYEDKTFKEMSDLDIDKALFELRTKLEKEEGTPQLDYYISPFKERWFDNLNKKKNSSGEKIENFFPTITQFIEQSQTSSLAYAHYLKEIYGLKVTVSFGQGTLARMPWISLLAEGQTTSKGIYPGFLLCKEAGILLLTYGSSEENDPECSWPKNDCLSTKEFMETNHQFQVPRYGHSKVFSSYDINTEIDKEALNKDLFDIVQQYKAALNNQTPSNSPQSNRHEVPPTMPINKIFYGPPGTGKTYKLQNLIKNNYTENAVIQDRDVWLSEQIDNLNWFEILVLVLLDASSPMKVPDIISHEYYQKKAALNNRSANLKQTAWAALQTHAIIDSTTVKYSKRIEPLVFDKTETSLWFINDKKDEQLEEYSSLLTSLKQGPQQAETIKRFEFVTFHQSYGYEEFIEGLRPLTTDAGDISYEVKPGVFKRICKRAETDPDHKYALVIDEINRGNISKIFGELISLVEVDKRKGSNNELTVTLPYSGLPFMVPSNLDIIGTMNTADRSLTHIDVALRRRFAFEELRTDYSLLSDNVSGINVKRMLYAMNQRIELLLDREHILGHAYLMNASSIEDLELSFKTNIMPLLEEYFFEDWEKISQVFNYNAFITENKEAQSIWLGAKDEYSPNSFRVNTAALKNVEAYQDIYSSIDNSAFAECE
jgi:hypothetical protein